MAFNRSPGFSDVFANSSLASGTSANKRMQDLIAQQTAAQQAPQPAQVQQQQQQQKQSDDMFAKIQAMITGRSNEIRNDPVQTGVMNYLQSVMGGQNVPYSDTVLNSLNAQHGRGTASAQGAQMQQLREAMGAGGGSIYDPSYQAASREMDSERQGRNLDYQGQLGAQAGLANQQAQQNASMSLGQLRSNQNAQISGLDQAMAGYQAGRFQEVQNQMPQTLMPQYGGGGSMGMAGGGGQRSQPKPETSFASTTPWNAENGFMQRQPTEVKGDPRAKSVGGAAPAPAAPSPTPEALNPGYTQAPNGAWIEKSPQPSTNNFDIASFFKGLVGMGA